MRGPYFASFGDGLVWDPGNRSGMGLFLLGAGTVKVEIFCVTLIFALFAHF